MKGALLLLAIFATECFCDHAEGCYASYQCRVNEFCLEDYNHPNNFRFNDGYCVVCPSNGPDECYGSTRSYDDCIDRCPEPSGPDPNC